MIPSRYHPRRFNFYFPPLYRIFIKQSLFLLKSIEGKGDGEERYSHYNSLQTFNIYKTHNLQSVYKARYNDTKYPRGIAFIFKERIYRDR